MKKGAVVVGNHSMSNEKSSEHNNPFEVLGLEPAFAIDPIVLDQAYFDRQRLAHPDRFIDHSVNERQAASRQASSLNEAYEALKNPILRAKALLKLRGFTSEEGKSAQDHIVLEEMMDLQEALIEATSPHDLMTLDNQINERWERVSVSFSTALDQNHTAELPQLFLRLTYLAKMRGDIKIRNRQSSLKVL